jgi:acetoacetyl-CoA synthetase
MLLPAKEREIIPDTSLFRMKTQPSATIGALTTIWETVLQNSPIEPDDNFFDLGGDSLSAVTLFVEIENFFGRHLPPVMIYNAPTIASLAAELERPTTSRLPPLVLLRAGSAAAPVFIAHGLGGSVIDFYSLVTLIESDRPIYGMQARGIDGVEDPFESIEEMAQYHLEAIKKMQPQGPYALVGYSLGGLVSMEIAHRLSAAGDQVALLAMLDAYPFRKYLSLSQRFRLSTRLALKRALIAIGISTPTTDIYSASPAKLRAQMSAGRRASKLSQSPAAASMTPAMLCAAEIAKAALRQYRPRFYPGTIKFVRAETVTDFPADPVAIWTRLTKRFEIETVPGDHLGMIATYPEALAAVISRYLNELTPGPIRS